MKRTFFVLAISLVLAFGLVTSASAWVYVPNYGATGWKTFSYTSTQANGDWLYDATLTFGVTNVGDTLLDSKLLVDNVKVWCNAGGYYDHSMDNPSFEGTMWSSTGTVNKVATSNAYGGSPTYTPTDGSYMAELTATASILSGGFEWHGPYNGYYGPTTLQFDWNFLGMDYVPYTDYSYAILKDAAGLQLAYFELGKIGAAVPEPTTLLLLGLGFLGLAGLRKRD